MPQSPPLPPLEAEQALVILAFMGIGIVYSAWFKRQRATLGFIGLAWFALALGAMPLGQGFGVALERDLSAVAYQCLPWNLLVLSLLPTSWTTFRTVWLWAALLLAQLLLPFVFTEAAWQAIPSLGGWINSQIPASVAGLLTPIEAVLTLIAALAMFMRWQLSERTNDLALCIVTSILLLGVLQPQTIFICTFGAGAVLLLSVLYSSHRMAFVDTLTGLPNRRAFEAASASINRRYAVAMLDVDHFKRINDRFGHDFGDQVLRMVAARIKRLRRFRVYRYGGEEFCLLFKHNRAQTAKESCEEARLAVAEQPIAMRGPKRPERKPLRKNRYRDKVASVKVTVSIGLAYVNEKRASFEAVINAADQALYRAKRGGRNKVVVAR